jgi:Domain of unknown function (DUF4136)
VIHSYNQSPRFSILIRILASCALVSTAAGEKIKVEFAPNADFSRVRLYQWRTHPVFEKHPDMKEVYGTGIQLVMQEGNAQLMKRGLQPADSSPDVFVTFFLQATGGSRTVTTSSPDPWWGPGYGWYASPTWVTTTVENYLQGMLVLDIVDARTSNLLWRAYCSEKIDDFRKRDKDIKSVVKKALERFPPKQK